MRVVVLLDTFLQVSASLLYDVVCPGRHAQDHVEGQLMRNVRCFACLTLLFLTATPPLHSSRSPTPEHGWVDRSPHQSALVEVNGIKLHYLDWGGQGETLLFLAGLGHNAHIFDDLAPRFTARFHVVAMTRRGFGLSDKPESGYDIETRVSDVLGFLDALHIERVILVGHSIAGDELTAFAAAHPDRVESLIYLDAAYDHSPLAAAVKDGHIDMNHPPGVAVVPKEALVSVDAYLSYFHQIFSREWSDALEASLMDGIEIHPDGTVTRRTSEDIYRAMLKGSWFVPLDYTRVKPPTLSLYEDPSIIVDPNARTGTAQEIDRNIALIQKSGPQIMTAEVQGAGHYLFIDHLGQVVNEMNNFLGKNHERRASSAGIGH